MKKEMTVLDHMLDFCGHMSFTRFKRSNKFQMKKTVYHRDMESAYVSAGVTLAQAILQSHHKNPYSNVDELLGDLHTTFKALWDYHHEKEGTLRKFSIEEIIDYGHDDMLKVFKRK